MSKTITLDRFLQKYHRQKWLKSDKVKRNSCRLKETLTKEGLLFVCNNSADYLKMQVLAKALSNKVRLETAYDEARNRLIEIWPTIDYQQRNHLINLELFSLKESLPRFESETGVMIMIPFFNELLNSLYHKEMVVFELPQFYKLYKQFSKECVDPLIYGIRPYRSGFVDVEFITENHDRFVMYDKSENILFISDLKTCIEYPLYEKTRPDESTIKKLGECLIHQDASGFMVLCLQHDLLSVKCAKKYAKVKTPLIFTNVRD